MIPEQQLPLLDDVIDKIKQKTPLTYEEELVYLMGIRKLSKDEASVVLQEEYQ